MNAEVRAEIKRKWRVRQLNRNLSTHRSYRNGNSSTFSAGGTCNDIREPLRPATRGSTSNSPPQRTQSNVKDRFLALKKNAFGSSNANGHVQLGNGSVGRRLPKFSRTDMTDAETSSRKVSPLKIAESEHLCPKVEAREEAHSDSETAKELVKQSNIAPLVRTMDELNRIHDSHVELSKNESACALLSNKEHDSNEDEPMAPPSASLSDKYDSANNDAACDAENQSENIAIKITNDAESPPAYNELFPEKTSSLANIETQV